MKILQSDRLEEQQKNAQGSMSIFHPTSRIHDKEVFNIIKEISLYETIYDENIYLGE